MYAAEQVANEFDKAMQREAYDVRVDHSGMIWEGIASQYIVDYIAKTPGPLHGDKKGRPRHVHVVCYCLRVALA